MQQERIDSRLVTYQPANNEILTAFAFYATRLPQNQQELAKGLLAAAAVDQASFLGRFVDGSTGQLTTEAQTYLENLQQERLLIAEGDFFIIPPPNTKERGLLSSPTRTYFKNDGVEVLKQAAQAAGKVWSPQ